MALTRITKGVIKPNENYDTHNIVSTGIVTSVGLDVNGSADISGSLSVGGVLTYEDVTSIDSVGLITARSGIRVIGAGSSVGIGTTDPIDKLQVFGGIVAGNATSGTFQSGFSILKPNDSQPRTFAIVSNNNDLKIGGGAWNNVNIDTAPQGSGTRVAITSTGYVGIGTAPDYPLHVFNSVANNIALFESGDPFANIGFSDSNKSVSFLTTLGSLRISVNGDAGTTGTNATLAVQIKNNGNVGIGTNDPGQALDIYNDSASIRLVDTDSSAGAGKTSYTQISNLNGNTYVYTRANENNGSYLIGGHANGVSDEHVRILQSGGVGINTTILPYGNFAVDHGQYGLTRISNHSHLLLQNKNAGTTDFWSVAPRDNARLGIGRGTPDANGTVSDEKFSILSNGKIGIGTETPNEDLDVTGTLAVGDNTLANNRPRIILSAPNLDGTNYRHLFGANLKVNSSGTFFTPAANISGGGWLYLAANSLNTHGHLQYMSAPDTNSSSSTPLERLRITSNGQLIVTGGENSNASYGIFQVNQAADNDESGIAVLNDANSRSMRIYVDASGNSVINSGDGGSAPLILNEGTGDVIVGKNLLPDADNDQDLGSSSKRWANIYTADLQLSNEGSTNDVDGTWGQYIIQEGEDDLFLINRRNGKKYKFMLEEVS